MSRVAAEVGQTRTRPFLTPSVPPPVPGRKIVPPAEGSFVRVVSSEGGYSGKVVFADESRIRLLEGAGWWDLDMASVLSVRQVERPVRRAVDPVRREQERARFEAHQLDRMLSRWP